jgi:hypothetical protein
MTEWQKAILYGNLLALAGMKMSLAAYLSFDVITPGISPSLTVRDLCALGASVILGDDPTRVSPFHFQRHTQQTIAEVHQ